MARTAARLAAGALAVAALVLGAVLPAGAATGGSVLVSTDGVRFSTSLPAGVFPGTTVLIPGAASTATLYVKNNSAVPSRLFVSASRVVASSPEFARSLSLTATSAASPASAAVRLDLAATCAELLVQPLAPGAITRLTVTLAMADLVAEVAQGDSVAATLGLALHEADPALAPVSGCGLEGLQLPVLALPADGDNTGPVTTGSAAVSPALTGAAVLLGLVAWLVLAGRRRERRDR